MFHIKNLSIRLKLTLAIVLTSVIALAVASIAFIITDRSSTRDNLVKNISMMSHIIADNTTSAVQFNDDLTAVEVLQAAGRDEHVLWAVVTLPDGTRFASFTRKGASLPVTMPERSETGVVFSDQFLTVHTPVVAGTERIGTLWIRSDLGWIKARQTWFLGVSAIVLIGASLIGLLVAFVLQRVISRPIGELENGANHLAVGNLDYNIEYQSKDELGRLADTFREVKDYLKSLAEKAQRIAARDLTVSVEPKSEQDELGNSFKTMVDNLTKMMRQLDDNACRMVTIVDEIFNSSQHMSQGAQDQVEQVSEISTAIEEMTATIVQSSKNAGEVSVASRGASDTATSGGEVVTRTIEGMQSLSQVVSDSANSIRKLAESADEIGQIVSVIDDIADQTNLLALNAAIEAARAGEQGRGFAVVADEVRKLAERTGQATGKIAQVIKAVQSKTTSAVDAMETGLTEVDRGRELADRAGKSLSEIVAMSQRVMEMIEQIATAAEEQSRVAENVSQRIEVVTSVSRDTAKQAHDSSGATQNLKDQAYELRKVVASFKI